MTIRARSTDMGDDVPCIRRIKADDGFRILKVTAHYPAGSSGGTFTDGYLATYKNGV